ncbi:unnamed protein product, partial [Arabidopsis halleri]
LVRRRKIFLVCRVEKERGNKKIDFCEEGLTTKPDLSV